MKSEDTQDLRGPGDTIEQRLRSAHTPIIITDGSASIEFDGHEYEEDLRTGEFHGRNLRITQIRVVDKNAPNNDHISICGPFDPSENLKVTVVCAGENFDITQRADRIHIKFNRRVFGEQGSAPSRRKFLGAGQRITALEVRNSAGTLLHRCRVIPGNGSCRIEIVDSHA